MSRSHIGPLLVLSALALVAVSSCKRNRPPDVPAVPTGPSICFKDTSYTFSTTATDPDGDSVAVRFDWGDSTLSSWSNWFPSGDTVALTHAWPDTGTYQVCAKAEDRKELSSGWSYGLMVRVVPHPPLNTPLAPAGPTFCFKDTTYSFAAIATGPDGDSVAVRFDWGGSTLSNWSTWFEGGDTVAMSHVWHDSGTYEVRAQAMDKEQHLSGWSDALTVQVVYRRPPNTPAAPTGPEIGGRDSSYTFATVAFHPDSITVAIRFAWGYGDTSAWSDFVASGESVRMNHAWSVPGTYAITAQAKDTGDALSTWSPPCGITIKPPDTLRKWRFQLRDSEGSYLQSSPAIGPDGTIYVGSTDSSLCAINPDGTLKWRYPAGGELRVAPAIAADGTVYVGSLDHRVYAINPDGTLKWTYSVGGTMRSSPAIATDGTIYVGSGDHHVYAINPDSTLKWRYETGGYIRSSPAISSDGTIYVGSDDSYLYALNPDGTLKWRYQTGGRIESAPTIGPDGTVYFTSDDGYLYALKGTGPLAGSAWPKFHHDLANTGRVGGGR